MAIDQFFKVFSPQPLVGGSPYYVDLFEVRGDNPIKSLARRLIAGPKDKQHILFSGFTGCGKSTELNKLAKQLEDENDFIIVHLNITKDIDPINVSYVELLPLAMEKLFKAVHHHKIKVDENLLDTINHWKDDKEIEKIKEFTKGAETKAGTEGKYSLLGFVKFYGSLNASMSTSRSAKETITNIIEPRLSDLINHCNDLIREIKQKLQKIDKKGLLIIFENMDKLSRERSENLFYDHSNVLTALKANIIYTFPISLRHSDKYNTIANKFNDGFKLPMVKVIEKDGSNYKPGRAALLDVILKRVEKSDFDNEDLINHFIEKSGGVMRDLFKLLNAAADNALNYERNTINEEDFTYAVNRLKNDYEYALAERRSENDEDVLIEVSDIYKTLKKLVANHNKTIDNNLVTLSLLENQSILGYNGDNWYDVHPIVKDILKERGILN